VIATGSKPSVPNIPGKNLGITSDGFFDLVDLPKKVAISGAGINKKNYKKLLFIHK